MRSRSSSSVAVVISYIYIHNLCVNWISVIARILNICMWWSCFFSTFFFFNFFFAMHMMMMIHCDWMWVWAKHLCAVNRYLGLSPSRLTIWWYWDSCYSPTSSSVYFTTHPMSLNSLSTHSCACIFASMENWICMWKYFTRLCTFCIYANTRPKRYDSDGGNGCRHQNEQKKSGYVQDDGGNKFNPPSVEYVFVSDASLRE